MDRIFESNASATPTPVPVPGSYGFPVGDPTLPGFTPTEPGPWFYEWMTESTMNVIDYAGITPDGNVLTQLRDAIKIIAMPPPPPPTDPYWANVVLLLHGEGVNGSTTIVDSSSAAHALTNQGEGVSIDTTSGQFPGGALSFAGGWLGLLSGLQFIGQPLTVEAWLYLPEIPVGGASVLSSLTPLFTDGPMTLWIQGDGTIQFYSAIEEANDPLDVHTSPGVFTAATWHFLSFTQIVIGGDIHNVGNQWLVHLDGHLVASRTGRVHSSYGGDINIGNYGETVAQQTFVGKMQEYRLTYGRARYSEDDYVVPSARFPNS